jgi:hypothetical protein
MFRLKPTGLLTAYLTTTFSLAFRTDGVLRFLQGGARTKHAVRSASGGVPIREETGLTQADGSFCEPNVHDVYYKMSFLL